LVSNGTRHDLFLLDSAKIHHGAGERILYVIRAGDSTTIFGGDEEIIKCERLTADREMIIFPADAVGFYPDCEAHWKEVEANSLVFINGRFLHFCASD
jgi:hypothetical protein